jgi:hypothetical protein
MQKHLKSLIAGLLLASPFVASGARAEEPCVDIRQPIPISGKNMLLDFMRLRAGHLPQSEDGDAGTVTIGLENFGATVPTQDTLVLDRVMDNGTRIHLEADLSHCSFDAGKGVRKLIADPCSQAEFSGYVQLDEKIQAQVLQAEASGGACVSGIGLEAYHSTEVQNRHATLYVKKLHVYLNHSNKDHPVKVTRETDSRVKHYDETRPRSGAELNAMSADIAI